METIKQLDCSIWQWLSQVESWACDTKKEVSEILAMPNRKLNYKEVSEKLVSQLREYLKCFMTKRICCRSFRMNW